MENAKTDSAAASGIGIFVSRVLVIIAAGAVAYTLFKLSSLLLLIVSAVVIAVIIHLVADPLRSQLKISGKLAVLLSVIFFLAILGGGGYLLGAKAVAQFDTLAENLPQAVTKLKDALSNGAFGRAIGGVFSGGDGASAMDVAGFVRSMVGGTMTLLVYFVATFTAGVIFAIYPGQYRDGALLLLPPRLRDQVREALNLCGRALKGWLIGQLASMLIIGALTSAGLMAIGLPSWLALGLVAGVAQFVPVVGPILSALPGLVLAASIDMSMLARALLVYVGVQQLESNFITPFVMRQTASLPMALTVFSIIGFGILFGPLGAVVATPMTVAVYVLVQKLYIENQFGDDLDVKGE